jgi:hypothetical protein
MSPSADLSPFAAFHDQFLLSRTRLAPLSGWQELDGAGWHLIAHPSLPVARLRTADGVEAGFALGHLIDGEGRIAREVLALPMTASGVAAPDLERFLYGFGGRFAVLVSLGRLERVYVDPLASLSTVWCGRRRRVASTPSLLLHDEPDHPLFRPGSGEFPRDRPNQFFPADLTAAPGIRRIVPNHVLDLATWSAARHHPTAPHREAEEDEIPHLVATVHRVLGRQIAAVLAECGGGYLGLTAGHDSRRLLACARDSVERLECVTLRPPSASSRKVSSLDLRLASRLASRFGLRHRVLEVRQIPAETAEDYVRRIGYAGGPGKAAKFFDPPSRQLDLGRAWMTGHGGGLCSAKYLRRMPGEERPDGRRLLRLLRLPELLGFVEAMERWSAGLPVGPRELRLDLAMLEHQGGGWASPHLYGTAPFRAKLLPIAHREAIDAILRVPAAHRASGRFDEELFRQAWPELLELPFNEPIGLQRWAAKVGSLFSSRGRGRRRRPPASSRARPARQGAGGAAGEPGQ